MPINDNFSLDFSDCACVTCSLAGGPNQRGDTSDNQEADPRCARCLLYEQLDLDYLGYVKRDLSRALDEPFPDFEGSEDDSDNDIDDIWKTNHSYHLAWAVFKQLPGSCAHPISAIFTVGLWILLMIVPFFSPISDKYRSKSVQCLEIRSTTFLYVPKSAVSSY